MASLEPHPVVLASVADGLAKPHAVGGLAWGDGTVVLLFGGLIVAFVTYLGFTRSDVQAEARNVSSSTQR